MGGWLSRGVLASANSTRPAVAMGAGRAMENEDAFSKAMFDSRQYKGYMSA